MRINTISRWIIIILLLSVFFGNSYASDKPEENFSAPPVEELVAEALEKSPAVAAVRSRVAASKELIEPASALPDPELEFLLEENISSLSSPVFVKGEIVLKQDFPFPGKRSVLEKTAGAESEMEYAGLIDIERQVTRDVRTIYAGLYALDREAAVLEIAGELVKMLEATAASRYSTGEGDQESQIKAQIESSRLTERINDIAAERGGMAAGLNRLLGRSGSFPVGKVAALPSVSVKDEGIESLEALALANSPALYIKKGSVKSAEYRLESADLDFWPDFFAGVGIGFDNEYDPMALITFGITLPVWQNSKQKPLKRAAGHKLEEAKKNLKEAETVISSEIADLFTKWNRDQKQIKRYRDAIIPQTSAALNSARASYIAGRADFSVVIEDYRLWLDALSQLARRESDKFITWAGIDALTAPFPLNE
ncbi:MAG: TolC family protein [Thermodesulfobacteriota bacterium]|nr:TolC family protein [Thermodesulfobacteriota bacterium]